MYYVLNDADNISTDIGTRCFPTLELARKAMIDAVNQIQGIIVEKNVDEYSASVSLADGDLFYWTIFTMSDDSRVQNVLQEKPHVPERPWYQENWYEEDLVEALENNGLEPTDENLRRLKEAAIPVFDDKSARNEILDALASELLKEG